MAARTRLVDYQDALRELAATVAGLQKADALAPVTIVVNSHQVAGLVRRSLLLAQPRRGGERRGLAGLRLLTLADLARHLGEPALLLRGDRPLTWVMLAGALRAALRLEADLLKPVVEHPSTEQELVRSYGELRWLPPGALRRRRSRPGLAGEIARCCSRAAGMLEGFFDEVDLLAEARRQLRSPAPEAGVTLVRPGSPGSRRSGEPGRSDWTDRVVLYLPERLRGAEVALLAELGRHGDLTALVGVLGDPVADLAVPRLLRALREAGASLEEGRLERLLPAPPSPAALQAMAAVDPLDFDEVVHAPDPPSEVRAALRLVLEALESGSAPERCAVLACAAQPYLELLEGILDEAAMPLEAAGPAGPAQAALGLPWQGPSTKPLSSFTSFRVLTGLLELAAKEAMGRRAVTDWFSSAPILDEAGHVVPAAEWDRCSRLAGVPTGPPSLWRRQLALWASEVQPSEVQPSEVQPSEVQPSARERTAIAARSLSAAIEQLGECCAAGRAARSWRELASWSRAALVRYLGPEDRRAGFENGAGSADSALVELLEELAELDRLEPAPDLHRFSQALALAGGRSCPKDGVVCHGVVLGQPESVVGASFDLVVVLGCAEGSLPALQRSRLPYDAAGQEEGASLSAGAGQGAEARPGGRVQALAWQRRSLAAVLACARRRVALVPGYDGARGRPREPSRWLPVKAAQTRAPGFAESLDKREPGRTALSQVELECSLLAGLEASGGALAEEPLALRLGLREGLLAAAARSAGAFGAYSGDLGTMAELAASRVWSPTALQTYATCPFRFFLGSVLGCEAVDRPEGRLEIEARDRGSMVHEVLQRFLAGQAEGAGESRAAPAGHAEAGEPLVAIGGPEELVAIAREVFGRYERQGKTGRGVLWEAEQRKLLEWLEQERQADERRLEEGCRVLAVEQEFGFGQSPPLERLIAGAPVRFKGRIDRVDRTADARLWVIDYKTGSPMRYEASEGDLVKAGRQLQLVVYALAARQALASDDAAQAAPVLASYRLVGPQGGEVTFLVDRQLERRLEEVLEVLLAGVRAGLFPLRPGASSQGQFENCRWCDFHVLCPSRRGLHFEQASADERLAAYLALSDTDHGRTDQG